MKHGNSMWGTLQRGQAGDQGRGNGVQRENREKEKEARKREEEQKGRM
jgi:hypothetical protein